MSELAPAKLFPSDDTIINVDEDALETKVSNTFGTPVVLRRGAYSRNQVERVTSDLTSSIMSELSLNSHISQDTLREDHVIQSRFDRWTDGTRILLKTWSCATKITASQALQGRELKT